MRRWTGGEGWSEERERERDKRGENTPRSHRNMEVTSGTTNGSSE